MTEKTVMLRFGTAGHDNLARLAALDSAQPPEQPVLLAEVDRHSSSRWRSQTARSSPTHSIERPI